MRITWEHTFISCDKIDLCHIFSAVWQLFLVSFHFIQTEDIKPDKNITLLISPWLTVVYRKKLSNVYHFLGVLIKDIS